MPATILLMVGMASLAGSLVRIQYASYHWCFCLLSGELNFSQNCKIATREPILQSDVQPEGCLLFSCDARKGLYLYFTKAGKLSLVQHKGERQWQ